jgi:guanine deaminase
MEDDSLAMPAIRIQPEHLAFMGNAIDLASRNVRSGAGGPFGAVVVKDGKVIATGVNQVVALSDPTAHAEILAIRAACQSLGSFELEGCDLYASCEPCPMCLGAIYWARPRALYYAATRMDAANAGFDDAAIYAEFALPSDARRIRMIQIPHPMASQSFELWTQAKDKIVY